MPAIDDGLTDGPPGNPLRSAWVRFTPEEAYALLETLKAWAEEVDASTHDPGWHTHITDDAGNELTIAIDEPESDAF